MFVFDVPFFRTPPLHSQVAPTSTPTARSILDSGRSLCPGRVPVDLVPGTENGKTGTESGRIKRPGNPVYIRRVVRAFIHDNKEKIPPLLTPSTYSTSSSGSISY